MNKSEIRKKILKIRKQKYSKDIQINFQSMIKVLKKNDNKKKLLGGYYPYNYEIDIMPILEKFERSKYRLSLPKIKKDSEMNFFEWSTLTKSKKPLRKIIMLKY